MRIVMCNVLQCPYCQFCAFEDDCSSKEKYDAREESKREQPNGLEYFEVPDCFQDIDDIMMPMEGGLIHE